MEHKTISIDLDGRTIIIETGKIARQANGSVMLHCGETTLLATACAAPEVSDTEGDFLPLRVDYQEKFSAAGKTLGGFIKREGKPSTKEVLISRFIDRTIRPLFEEGYYNEVQVLAYVYSYDGINTPDVLAICACSAALVLSDIPLLKPVGAVRVGLINDNFVINPNPEEQKSSKLDLVLGGTEDAILMIEGFCDFLTEEQILEAIDFGHTAIRKFCMALKKWQVEIGKEKNNKSLYTLPKEAWDAVVALSSKKIKEALTIVNKKEREAVFTEIKKELFETLVNEESPKFTGKDVSFAYKKLSSDLMRKMVLEENRRIDGRKLDEIRPIEIETGTLPRTHGNAIFTRGETQSIAVCTLGSETMVQRYEDIHGEGEQRFYLQYFFPPFSVGEVGRLGAPGRREIGHGKLAERSLENILPDQKTFPYVIRLESNITESNGSSSMASVCGGCLALMNAGVPVKRIVSGIAMGLILEGEKFKILSDIIGAEDALGDMDFKLAGDDDGITAFQMDIKVEGITKEIMREALIQAKAGRSHILKKMKEACPTPKADLSVYAPRIETIRIKMSQIGAVIGPGGKNIKSIIEQTGVEIDISNDGLITIAATNPEGINKAKDIILGITGEAEVNKVYKGVITGIKDFGLFVRVIGQQEGLCHISEISHSRVNNLNQLYKEGDTIEVKVLDINSNGQIKLSHKALLPLPPSKDLSSKDKGPSKD